MFKEQIDYSKDFDFSDYGAFWAFSQKQFEEGKEKLSKQFGKDISNDDLIVIEAFGGIIVLKENANELLKDCFTFHKKQREREIKTKGKDKIILDDLYNHESFYTNDILLVVENMKLYGFTREDVERVYWENF